MHNNGIELGEKAVEGEMLLPTNQIGCKHSKCRKYVQRSFDILNGFELEAEKCCDCHKILELTIKRIR